MCHPQKKKNLSLSLKDLKHDGIMRAKVYIKKVSCSSFNDESQEWEEIIKINKLRNILVHSDGVMLQNTHPNYEIIKSYIDSNSGLEISETGHISIKDTYVVSVVKTFKSYLNELFREQDNEFKS